MKRILTVLLSFLATNLIAQPYWGIQVDGTYSAGLDEMKYELNLKPSFHKKIGDKLELSTQFMLTQSILKTDTGLLNIKTTQYGMGFSFGTYYQLYKLFSFKVSAGPEFPFYYYTQPRLEIKSNGKTTTSRENNYTRGKNHHIQHDKRLNICNNALRDRFMIQTNRYDRIRMY